MNKAEEGIRMSKHVLQIKVCWNKNEMKDTMKVIKCFEKRKILLKGTTGKLTSPKGRLS